MASATGIPEENPALQEEEPLLGRPGDATQHPGQGLQWNFIKGTGKRSESKLAGSEKNIMLNTVTGILAQAGIFILTALVWAAVFQNDIIFFSYHPILNSLAVLLMTQSILVLQPTASQKDKVTGTYVHSALNSTAVALLIAGLVVIEQNKASHPETRFQSVHGKMALVAYIFIFLQWFVGGAIFYLQEPLFGTVDRAKSLYKYHRYGAMLRTGLGEELIEVFCCRISGYVLAVYLLAVIAAATQTPYNENVLHMKLWAVIVASVLVLIGVVPRIKKHKFGL